MVSFFFFLRTALVLWFLFSFFPLRTFLVLWSDHGVFFPLFCFFPVLEGDGDDDRSNDHEDIMEPPEDGVIIYGIHVQGMRWDGGNNCLEDSKKGEMFSVLPPIHFLPARDRKAKEGCYVTPVYKTTARAGSLSTTGTSTNYVVAVELPSAHSQLHWILNGGAGILNLDV